MAGCPLMVGPAGCNPGTSAGGAAKPSAAANRAKDDQGPDDWQPPAKPYWCTYATAWTNVKSTYRLAVTQAEKAKLTEMPETCR